MVRILFLYSELGPYNYPVFEALTHSFGAKIVVISWDNERHKPYLPQKISGVTYHKRSRLDERGIFRLSLSFDPDLVYISGWMDRGYLQSGKYYKKKGVPVVVGFDDFWEGTLRQQVGRIFYKIYLQNFFSHAWVAGPRQYEFARKLGFKNSNILFDLLSCNVDSFASGELRNGKDWPKRFLYVGNFRSVKGTDILLNGYQQYREKYSGDWKLTCVGRGELLEKVKACLDVVYLPYRDQTELHSVHKNSGCFILPSRHDQWGVVVHEFAAAGLPLILSENVGAKSTFFIEGYNGFSYLDNSPYALAKAMQKISSLSSPRLAEMGRHSAALSLRISPETSAANLMSVFFNR